MLKLRRMLALIAGLTVIVVGGAALAQVGTFAPDDDTTVVAEGDVASAPFIGIPEDGSNDATAEKQDGESTDGEKPSDDGTETKDDGSDDETKDDVVEDGTGDGGDGDDETKDDPVKDLGIEFLSPESGTRVEVGELAVKGIVNQPARVTVNGHPVEVGPEGHWSKVVGLEPGKNVLAARAENEAGHVAEASIVVYWDKEEPPVRLGIEVTSPRNGTETERESIKIQGYVNAPARVVVGDWLAEVNDNGSWWVVVPLRPGKNHFVATAKTESGATASDEITIYRITDHKELGIEITNLHNEMKVDDGEIKVRGVISTNATVKVNGVKATVNDDLTWYAWIGLEPGWNRIVAVAFNDFGETKDVVEIFRVTKETVEFTANQVYGSCGEEIPYDVFWGRADAGEKIWIESPYDVFHGTAIPGTVIHVLADFGSGETVTDETGHWELRVEFPEAPYFKEFQVKVKASTGEYKYFSFVRTGEEHGA